MFLRFRDEIRALPSGRLSPDQIVDDVFFLERENDLAIYYAPFDHIEAGALVTIVGVTPGLTQMTAAFEEASRLLKDGFDDEHVLKSAKYVASFSGSIRSNLVAMLDQAGVPNALGVQSSAELFDPAQGLLHPTSAIRYPAFRNGRNYTGSSPRLVSSPLLVSYLETVLAPELERVPQSLVIPLGRAVEVALDWLIDRGNLNERRCLFGFPHPSGANGHRVVQFERNRDALASTVSGWFEQGKGSTAASSK